jgi:N-acetylmuramoyl-L-alanine amidase
MHVDEVAAHEASFDQYGKDTSGNRHNRTPRQLSTPGVDLALHYTEVRPASGDRSYYDTTKVPKDQIVLHLTEGYLRSDVAMLTRPGTMVSVPYLLGRNGTIYEVHPPDAWSYHLGPGAVGGNQPRSSRTIGIELSNVGPLRRSGQSLITNLSAPGKPDIYCTAAETHAYRSASFRGYEHFATLTELQYEALFALLRHLLARFQIPPVLLHPSQRTSTVPGIAAFRGITTHVNYRETGKVDIGPAFEWDRLAEAIGAKIADPLPG